MQGVSVIICCYNSAGRLKETLSALARQRFHSRIDWEIVLVDNASTDNTAEAATMLWEAFAADGLSDAAGPGSRPIVDVPLRIVAEPTPGLAYARKKGIAEAAYSVLLFCDDDNWLCPDYVQGVSDILSSDASVAACGGKGIPVFEASKPEWFDDYAEAFATGPQDVNVDDGRIISLYGAGLAIRRRTLEECFPEDLNLLTKGRTGKSLSSGEDIEMTYTFVLRGYKLVYAKDLWFSHYLPQGRLNKQYLGRLFKAFGKDGPIRNLYYAHITTRPSHQRITNWYYHLLLSLFRTGKYLAIPPKKAARLLYFRWNLAYIHQLLTMKTEYQTMLHHISSLRGPLPTESRRQTVAQL